jgi:hypothetical protein
MKISDRIDILAQKFYGDQTLGWVIMCANPQYFHEWEVNQGDEIRIPFPLERILSELGSQGEL